MSASVPELLPWLVPFWERLGRAREADRLPHALLISGPRGVGKRVLAELLSRALLCARPQPDGTPCGECRDCRLTAAGSHPDLVRVGPDPELKSGEISIESIRDLTGRAALSGGTAAYRPVLIDPADRMGPAAANALLKTLEEPPPAVLMCLVAERPGRLPATIRSRCQQIAVGLPREDLALEWLGRRIGPEGAARRLGPARGAPLRALDEIDEQVLDRHRSLLQSLVAIARGEGDPVGESAAWNLPGARLSLEWLAGWLCDLARIQAAGPEVRLDDAQGRGPLGELAPRIDRGAVHRLLGRVFEARGLTETTVNPQLLLESVLIEWARLAGR